MVSEPVVQSKNGVHQEYLLELKTVHATIKRYSHTYCKLNARTPRISQQDQHILDLFAKHIGYLERLSNSLFCSLILDGYHQDSIEAYLCNIIPLRYIKWSPKTNYTAPIKNDNPAEKEY